jgi:tetratricopeptide (TPR) repeat protein
MKKFFYLTILAAFLTSCGPIRHAIHVEMRHPSKSGIEFVGKNVAVVHLENDNAIGNSLSEGIADGLAYSLEQDYGTGEGSVGIYRMRVVTGGNYASKDTLVNLLLDTGSDIVFLIDTLATGKMTVGGATSVASPSSRDSSYLSTGNLPFKINLYCFDAMNSNEKVYTYSGSSVAVPYAYSDGRQSAETIRQRALASLPELGFEAGMNISTSFKSQWKYEQYSVVYFESPQWFTAMEHADRYQWKDAMDIWIKLLDTNDMLKRSCAAYNLALASYMLGDYDLASEWLDRSDKDNKLPMSDTLRKRIDSRK